MHRKKKEKIAREWDGMTFFWVPSHGIAENSHGKTVIPQETKNPVIDIYIDIDIFVFCFFS